MPKDIATLLVGGNKFEDWESVWVQHILGDPFSQFKFTAAEREPSAQTFALLQIKPADECVIEMSDDLAMNGIVLVRQAAYDENNHGVMLQGVSNSWGASSASVIHKTGNFDGKSFKQIADEVLEPTGVNGTTFGNLNNKPFERMQMHPGDSVFTFLARIAKERDILITCTVDGNFLFVAQDAPSENVGNLVEGENIRKCQCVISISEQRSLFVVRGQSAGTDDNKMRPPAEQEATAKGELKKIYRPLLVPNEQPVWTANELKIRADTESKWTKAHAVQATIVVQGWTSSSGGLWKVGKKVTVKSPMAMLDMEMGIQSVTFTQDNNTGTLTTLLCVAPWSLDLGIGFSRGGSPVALPPAAAQSNSSPPQSGGVGHN